VGPSPSTPPIASRRCCWPDRRRGAVDAAAEALLRVGARVDPAKHGKPALLAVITGWGYGYRRPDGIAVIPIGALAP